MRDCVFTTRLIQLMPRPWVRVVPAAVAAAGDDGWLAAARDSLGAAGEVLRGTRWVGFRAGAAGAPQWLACCLRDGYVPVVIGNGVALPFGESIDYSEACVVLGEAETELGLLSSFSTRRDVWAWVARGREIGERWFTAEGIRRGIRAAGGGDGAVILDTDPSAAGLAESPFPAFRRDGSLVTEGDLFRIAWQAVGRQFPKGSGQAVVICGAGRFTRRLLGEVRGMPGGPEVAAIIDDRAEPDQTLAGLPVLAPERVDRDRFAAVFVGSDSVEDRLAARCREVYGEPVRLLLPSVLMRQTEQGEGEGARRVRVEAKGEGERAKGGSRAAWQDGRGDGAWGAGGGGKLEAVVVCVGYGDMLAWTLPWNRREFDVVAVVTSSEDRETQAVAREQGARVVISDRFRDQGAPFNKGRMLNDGFAALDGDGWVLITDADMLFLPGLRRRLMQRWLHPDCLYFATRVDAPADGLGEWLRRFRDDWTTAYALPFREPGRNRMPWGYFQLVHPAAGPLRGRGSALYDEQFGTACDVDYAFQDRWTAATRILLPELAVHIPHGVEGTNWRGRQSARLTPS